MPSSEDPENPGSQASYPKGISFFKLLRWHLDLGTRPRGSPDRSGKRWSNKEFAEAVGVTDRAVRYWRTGKGRPTYLGSIQQALFGDNDAYNQWNSDLRAAYDGHERSAPGTPIPLPPAYFLGRARDVATLLDVLLSAAPTQAILVQGGPGIGKTSLTQAVGSHPKVVERFDEGNRWFVPLDLASTAAAMQDAISRSVGGDPAHGFEATLSLLRQRPGLLVLDNLETPWEPRTERRKTESMLAALAAVPGLALLASFRGGDRVGGPAWALVHPVAHLNSSVSANLFCRIAEWRYPDDPHLQDFIAALGGIPLAIELVAARAHGRASLGELWTQWTRIGGALASHPDYDAALLIFAEN